MDIRVSLVSSLYIYFAVGKVGSYRMLLQQLIYKELIKVTHWAIKLLFVYQNNVICEKLKQQFQKKIFNTIVY